MSQLHNYINLDYEIDLKQKRFVRLHETFFYYINYYAEKKGGH